MEEIKNSERDQIIYRRSYNKLQCHYCDKILSSRQNLREHTYVHTGQKPYCCKVPGCNKRFRQGSLLSIHKKIHSKVKKRSYEIGIDREKYPKLTQLLSQENNNNLIECNFYVPLKIEIGDLFYFIKEFL